MIGSLDKRVKVLNQIKIPDGYSGYSVAYGEVLNTWAKVRPVSSDRLLEGGAPDIQNQWKVTVRKRNGFDFSKAQLIEYKGLLLFINGIINIDEANQYIEVACTASDVQGTLMPTGDVVDGCLVFTLCGNG